MVHFLISDCIQGDDSTFCQPLLAILLLEEEEEEGSVGAVEEGGLTDFASFLISLFAIWMAAKPKSQKMSFGWHRAEVLGATVSVLMIWLVTGILVYMAILR